MTVGNTIGKMIDLTARQSLVMNNSGKDLSSAQVPQDTPAPTPQPSSAFERWRRKAMLVTGLGVSEDERLADLQESHIRDCERKKEYLMNYSKHLHTN
jgi:inner membrane protease ATP23